jgi:TetR/AcrR family transcriptional repressor of mexJK operon
MVAGGERPQRREARPRRTRGRPRPEEAAAIDDALLAIALQEFIEHGYGGASMSRIIAAAGVSKTTLYSRYRSKRELFNATLKLKNVDPHAWTVLRESIRSMDLRAALVACMDHMLARNLEADLLAMNRLILNESARFPELGLEAQAKRAIGISRISALLREYAERDGIPCRDPDSVAAMFIHASGGWYSTTTRLATQPVPEAELQQWVERAVDLLLGGREQW